MGASSEVILAALTATNAAAASAVVRTLFNAMRRRRKTDQLNKNAATAIERVIAQARVGGMPSSEAIKLIITALDDTRDAVVVLGNQAVVKDSATGRPKVVVRNLSPGQQEKISSHQAPVDDAIVFQAWLDETRQAESFG